MVVGANGLFRLRWACRDKHLLLEVKGDDCCSLSSFSVSLTVMHASTRVRNTLQIPRGKLVCYEVQTVNWRSTGGELLLKVPESQFNRHLSLTWMTFYEFCLLAMSGTETLAVCLSLVTMMLSGCSLKFGIQTWTQIKTETFHLMCNRSTVGGRFTTFVSVVKYL